MCPKPAASGQTNRRCPQIAGQVSLREVTQGTPSRWPGGLQATLWAFEPEPRADRKEVGPAVSQSRAASCIFFKGTCSVFLARTHAPVSQRFVKHGFHQVFFFQFCCTSDPFEVQPFGVFKMQIISSHFLP